MNMHSHITKFISSQQRESSETRKHIINLGKALVEELDIEPGVDTLGCWIAHYVAEQMVLAENSTGEAKTIADKECFETILKLWRHRAYYPHGRQPFENFDRIFRTLDRLDPDSSRTYFYTGPSENSDEVDDNVQKWLNVALGIDEVARTWLEYVFQQATRSATDNKTIEWLENSIGLPEDDDALTVARLLAVYKSESDDEAPLRLKRAKREEIETRITKLDAFIEFSHTLRAAFVRDLEKTESLE